ncbi:phage head morphogenesis protein [Afifella pfennigii]|uniref:phage head morphogenesis protein n=1 Tax=Afifella pfennigii TaxID=209897 RepID=UPI00068E819B|nr:phage minor head protein [Afifella pfennigii]
MPTTAEALDLPFEEAISFFRQKANVPTRRWSDVYAAAHSHSFMVAGAASDALLSDFRAEIDKALEQGTTLADFRKAFDGIVGKHGWSYTGGRNWRTRVIVETNLRTAFAAGRYAQQTLPETLAAFPFWQYHHSGSLHPREQHLAWDGLVLRADDPFWTTNYPPNGWRCGCFTTPVSEAGLRRQGKAGPDPSPQLSFETKVVGGVPRQVPNGVDPGFEYNPGQSWLSGGRPFEPVAEPERVAHFARRALAGELPVGATVPVAEVPAGVLADLGLGEGMRARLSVDTIRSHAHRAEITALDYQAAARRALAAGEIFEGPRGRLSGIVEISGRDHILGLKATRLGEFLVTTLHRGRAGQLKRIRGWRRLGR